MSQRRSTTTTRRRPERPPVAARTAIVSEEAESIDDDDVDDVEMEASSSSSNNNKNYNAPTQLRFASTTSLAAYGELIRRNDDLNALVTSLHAIEEAEETHLATRNHLGTRLHRWWAAGAGSANGGLVAALLGNYVPPSVHLVADARIAAPLSHATLPSYFSPSVSTHSSSSSSLSSSASSFFAPATSFLFATGHSGGDADAARDDDSALVSAQVAAPGVVGVTAGVMLLVTQVRSGGHVSSRAMSIAVAGAAATGVALYAIRRIAALAAAAAPPPRSTKRYDARHEYECRVQELKFRYEKMARTLRALRADARVMAHQREELYDVTALLARHDSLIRHAFLAIGIRPADADAILAPLVAQLRAFGSRSQRRRRSAADGGSAGGAGDDDALFSGLVPAAQPRVSVAVGKTRDGRGVLLGVGEQQLRATRPLGRNAQPRTEIVLRGVGEVSERKMRLMQEAVARIFAADNSDDDNDYDDDNDAAAANSAYSSRAPSMLPSSSSGGAGRRRGRRGSPATPSSSRPRASGDDSDDSFYSADEDDFVHRNAPFENSVDSAARSDTLTEDDDFSRGPANAHDLRSLVLQQQAKAALTPPQSRRRPRQPQRGDDADSPQPAKQLWTPQATAQPHHHHQHYVPPGQTTPMPPSAATAARKRQTRGESLYELAVRAGESVFVYKYRHAESGVSDVKRYRAQVHWLRRAFESLGEDQQAARAELMRLCEELAVALLSDVLGDRAATDAFTAAIRDLMAWVAANPDRARQDASRLKCRYLNAYDAFLEWILLDAFADLANVPSALSGWMPEAGKRALVVRQLDGKIAAANAANNEFQARYYTALKTLTPHLVVGFTSSNKQVAKVFGSLQQIVIERLYKRLFAVDIQTLYVSDGGESQFTGRVMEITRLALMDIRESIHQNNKKQ
jgi:hypothetical protein